MSTQELVARLGMWVTLAGVKIQWGPRNKADRL